MMRDTMIFYGSWVKASEALNDRARGKLYEAILRYGLFGEDNPPANVNANALYILAKPLIDSNNQKFINGQKGGRPPKKQDGTTARELVKKYGADAVMQAGVVLGEGVTIQEMKEYMANER